MGTSTNAILFFGYYVGDSEMDESINWDEVSKWAADNWKGKDGIELVTFCSYDYPMYGLASSESIITSYRGDDEEISVVDLMNRSDYGYKFKEKTDEWFKNLDITLPTELPCWHLVSMWG